MAVVLSATLGSCSDRLPTYRFRETVILDTPAGRRIGQSVVEVQAVLAPNFLGPQSGGVRRSVHGEAVAVALPNGRYLFATLRWRGEQSYSSMIAEAYKDQLARPTADFLRDGSEQAQATLFSKTVDLRGVRRVSPLQYPTFVSFRKMTDPQSIENVTPRNIGTVLGDGYKIRAVTVEIVDQPVTRKIELLLPWLRRDYDATVDIRSNNRRIRDLSDAQLVMHSDLAKGVQR
jgi:hypothetical protein